MGLSIASNTLVTSTPEAYYNSTGSLPWPPITRLHAGTPNHCYLSLRYGAVREDIYEGRTITEQCWHEAPSSALPNAVHEEAMELLEISDG
jgi:hypothetical protein